MMRGDLKAARKKWIEEAKRPDEKVERERLEARQAPRGSDAEAAEPPSSQTMAV
jgi:hypothetical protein